MGRWRTESSSQFTKNGSYFYISVARGCKLNWIEIILRMSKQMAAQSQHLKFNNQERRKMPNNLLEIFVMAVRIDCWMLLFQMRRRMVHLTPTTHTAKDTLKRKIMQTRQNLTASTSGAHLTLFNFAITTQPQVSAR